MHHQPADFSLGATTLSTGGSIAAPGVTDLEALAAELREALAPGIHLLDRMGEGGMGTVFLARDPALKRFVVVKVLSPDLAKDENARARFAREAEAAAAVAHPNVVAIYHVGRLPRSDTHYIVMQHIDGPTLEAAFPPGTVAPAARAARIVGEVAQALAAAHARGLVHRDIKPSNVMLDRESGRAVVVDFGISAAIRSEPALAAATRLTVEGASIGTPQYMSPEQAVGDVLTDRSDVYSLGLVAFELLAGRPVFEEHTPMALIAAHINRAPPNLADLRPHLDAGFAGLVDRCLGKDPAGRPSAADIARVLLPDAQALVEWPPPGLERIAGKGWALTRLGVWIGVAVVALMILLYLHPVMVSAAWASGERSWFWRAIWGPSLLFDEAFIRPVECSVRASRGEACPAANVDAGPLWLFALSVLILVITGTTLLVLRDCRRLVNALRQSHRSGYPWQVAIAAAWDSGPATSHLLNGSGPFALESEASRQRVARDRIAGDAWLTGGAIASVLAALLWLGGAITIGDAASRWLTLPELLVCALPIAAGVVQRMRLRGAERRLLARWNRSAPPAMRAELTPASLVQSWMATGNHLFVGAPVARPAVRRVLAVLTVAALGLAFALPVLGLTQVFSFWRAPTLRLWESQWLEFVQSSELDRVQWASMDSTLSMEIARLGRSGPDRGRVVAAAGVVDTQLRAQVARFTYLEPGKYEALQRDSSWAWLTALRLQADSAESGSPVERVGFPRNNVAAAVLALEAGETATARARVRDMLIATRQRLRHFGEPSWAYGVRTGVLLHIAVAEHSGDTIGIRTAADLHSRLGQFLLAHRIFIFVPFSGSLMADPAGSPALRFVGDRRQSPGLRRLLARATIAGQCYNGREMLFGTSPLRQRLVDSARVLVADLPGAAAELDSAAVRATRILGKPGALGWPSRFMRLADVMAGSESSVCTVL